MITIDPFPTKTGKIRLEGVEPAMKYILRHRVRLYQKTCGGRPPTIEIIQEWERKVKAGISIFN